MQRKSQFKLGKAALLQVEEGKLSLASLFGLAGDLAYRSPETGGIFALASTAVPQGYKFSLRRASKIKGVLRLELASPEGAEVVSQWEHDAATGVLRRRDTVRNRTGKALTLTRAMPRFTLARGRYKAYAQSSSWGLESQGAWHDLPSGAALEWGCERGRLCQPAAPYLCVAPEKGGDGVALQVASQGNWVIRLRAVEWAFVPGPPFAVLEAGLADRALALELKPGESLDLPELLLQGVPKGEPHLAAEPLHRHLLARDLKAQPRKPPLVFNSWFDRYDNIEPERLLQQAAVAKSLGAEVFTVDAGWFGKAGQAYDKQVGNWHEKPDAAFRGRMIDFARRIRAMGMGFGLWMEPERMAHGAAQRKRHPGWWVETAPGKKEYRVDMENPQARRWIKGEISRVIKTYGLAWLKVDSNFSPGEDGRGRELNGYFGSWWSLLDEIRAENPQCFVEGCASGMLRLDLSALKHHDAHFLSDNVNPRFLTRFIQGTALRLPPSRITTWTVVKDDSKGGLLGPKVHSLGDGLPVDAGWVSAACMAGILMFSGDLLELSAKAKAELKHWFGFWKSRREFITSSSCHLLTPPAPRDDMNGWAALQLQAPKDPRRLLLAYRFDKASSGFLLKPLGLDPKRAYTLMSGEGKALGRRLGAVLMRKGLRIRLPKPFTAKIIELL